MTISEQAAANTDRELWRDRDSDYYADSIHVTQGGGIGIDCGGHVIVKPVREWHKLAVPQSLMGVEREKQLERVAQAALLFCQELQEDADGVPQVELKELNAALDDFEAGCKEADALPAQSGSEVREDVAQTKLYEGEIYELARQHLRNWGSDTPPEKVKMLIAFSETVRALPHTGQPLEGWQRKLERAADAESFTQEELRAVNGLGDVVCNYIERCRTKLALDGGIRAGVDHHIRQKVLPMLAARAKELLASFSAAPASPQPREGDKL